MHNYPWQYKNRCVNVFTYLMYMYLKPLEFNKLLTYINIEARYTLLLLRRQ